MRLSRLPLFPSRRASLRVLSLGAVVALLLSPTDASAQCVSLTTLGSAYTQNFDTLSNTAGSTTNNLTITGWFMTETGGGARDNEQYAVDTGASTTGDTYSYGAAAATDRALGQLRSGTLIPNFGSCYTNNTGSTIASLQVAYTGEQWRLGTATGRTDQMNFEYSTNATDLTTGTWTGVAALNFVTPDTVTVGAKNGNAAADRTALSATISALSIPNGATFWIRWADTDATGADDGLAVDDFSLTPQAAVALPNLTINDVSLNEGNAGTTSFTFTVSLSAPAGAGGVTFDIATADNTATQPSDYTQNSLTGQTIPAGSSTYSFTVLVNGDLTPETSETFFVNVTNVTGASVTDGQGQGTIVNDDAAPDLTINDVSLAEGNAGTTTFTFTVSLSAPAPAGGVTFDIATADGTATQPGDYTQQSLTGQTIAAGNSTYTFSVLVNGDVSQEADETFFVNVTNITNAIGVDTQGLGTIGNDDYTSIHTIQGNGISSPLATTAVVTRGVVTGIKSNGFFMQEPDTGIDADPLTSEGIFVFTSSAPPASVVLGNMVQVSATVSEFVPGTDIYQPPVTELVSPTVSLVSSGNPLPAPIVLTTSFPSPAGAFDQLERLEGMRVSVPSMTVIAPTQGSVNEANATSTSTGVFFGVVTGVPRPFREPGIQAPDPTPSGTIPPIPRFDTNPEMIRVDSDAQTGAAKIDVASDAILTGVVGPLDYGFRHYTIYPDAATTPVLASPGKTPTPVTTPTGMEFTVASQNLERFFDTVNDPESDAVLTVTAFNNRLKKASNAIRNFLKAPDIIGVEEMEHLSTLQALATQISSDAITAGQPDPLYQAFLVEGNDVGGIDVGFLAKGALVYGATKRVAVSSVVQESAATLFPNPDGIVANYSLLNDRPPLRMMATINHPNGASFPVTVIVNHLRSLSGVNDDTTPGSNGWATDGQRIRAKRLAQAVDLANIVQARQIADPAEHIILVGDFNAFEVNDGYGDSMSVIAGTPTPDNQTAVPGDGVDLVNPDLVNLFNTPPAAERYSYSFDGSAQTLDHILVNAPLITDTLAQREEHPRIDADFPEILRNDPTTPTRISDHDPVVSYYKVAAFATADLAVTNVDTPDPVAAGSNLSYAITVTNNGPEPAISASVTDTLPAGTTFLSLSSPGGWSCTTPAVGAGGTVSCSNASFGVGSAAFTLLVNVSLSVAPASVLSNTASAASSTAETNALDNSATATTTVSCAAISLASLPNGILGSGYLGSPSASGGTGPYTYATTSGSIPSGLALNASDPAGFTGTLSATGTFNFQITATDTAAPGTCTGFANYSVVIGSSVAASDLVIREFRLRGPAGANSATDEYVVIHNRTAAPITVASTDGSAGFGVASSDGNLVFTIPNGAVIAPKGFFLGANSAGYSIPGATDASWTTDIADGRGLGLFRTATPANFGAPTVIDAVGFAGGSAPYIEGAGLSSLGAVAGQYAWVRKAPAGPVQDTGANANDFMLLATDGSTYNGVPSILGAPAPTNSSLRDVLSGLNIQMAEPLVGPNLNPNRIRTGVLNSGTLEFRRRIVNNTGSTITAIRLRVNDLSTLNSPGYSNPAQADLRPGSGPNGAITATSIGVTSLTGLNLLTPPSQPIGGGVNSVLLLPLAPLANGASIDINIVLNISRVGSYRFFITVEAQ